MYSEQDLRDAVAAGAITDEAAHSLRAHVAVMRRMPVTDEENFRLLNSFNDIFVTIAAVLLLVAMAGLGTALVPGLAGALVALAAWVMAEFFTRRRRMALPSIVLLLAFVGGVIAAPLEVIVQSGADNDRVGTMLGAASFIAGAIAAYVHWKRFKVPITIAALAGTLAASVIIMIVSVLVPVGTQDPETTLLPLVFVAGLAIFAFAMRWDMSDRSRETRRSDVAFWLHLLAAPMIAHPLFHWVGITEGQAIGAGGAVLVLAIYLGFGIVALAVDRRALLVSALAYVLFALAQLFDQFGVVELNVALTALVIGSALLMLSAFWPAIRARIVHTLPGTMQDRLPLALALPAAA